MTRAASSSSSTLGERRRRRSSGSYLPCRSRSGRGRLPCASTARAYDADVSSSGYTPAQRSIDPRLQAAGAFKPVVASAGGRDGGGAERAPSASVSGPPRRPETPEERHDRRQAWGAYWSAAMRDAWSNRQRR